MCKNLGMIKNLRNLPVPHVPYQALASAGSNEVTNKEPTVTSQEGCCRNTFPDPIYLPACDPH